MNPIIKRCAWCGDDPIYQAYHDHEWGVPCHDDGKLFAMLCLEGMQAGLSWITILKSARLIMKLLMVLTLRRLPNTTAEKLMN